MATKPPNQRYLAYLDDERRAARMYRALAALTHGERADALRELAAIRATAEDAAARILDSAEGLLAFADKEEAKKAEDAILSIMTACGFHDLVGQRVAKITETLDQVIAGRLTGDDAALDESQAPNASGITLEGPALPPGKVDQAEIDALFAEPN